MDALIMHGDTITGRGLTFTITRAPAAGSLA
jgi:hypothetical protein